MNLSDASTSGPINFDVLRARIEGDVPRPGCILITSATSADGSDIAARNLALSFASIDYQTLLVEASSASPRLRKLSQGTNLEDATRTLIGISKPGTCVEVMLGEDAQQATSQAALSATLTSLRTTFDYLVIRADYTVATSFTTSAIDLADAVYVAVRATRRETKSDHHLAAALNRAGRRFLGVLSMPPTLLKAGLTMPKVPTIKADTYVTPAEKPLRVRG